MKTTSTVKVITFILLLSGPFVKAQAQVDYQDLVKSSWRLSEFNARYARENIKGSALLFTEFMLGRLIMNDGSRSDILFFNYDTVSKKLFTRKADRQRITNETHYHGIDSLIVFETASVDQKVLLHLKPEAFSAKRPYPTVYEALTTGKYVLLKETVMAFVKVGKAVSAYDENHSRQDYYQAVTKYYLSNEEGLYESVKMGKRSVLSILSEEQGEKAVRLAKENGLKWRSEPEIAQILMKLNGF